MQNKLSPSGLKQAEFQRNIYMAVPEFGVTYETVLKPDYWAHVARLLRPRDRIEVLAADGSFFAELLVQHVEKIAVKVFPLRHVQIESTETSTVESEDYEIKFRGPRKFSVLHKDSGEILYEDIPSKEEAEGKLYAYLKKMAA